MATIIVRLLLVFCVCGVTHAEPLRIASIDWCPQMCQGEERQGYVTEIVERVFAGSEYELDVTIYPWSRAIFMVRSGEAHALLSPTKNEAPGLLYPSHEVGQQKMCFFTLAESNWRFSGVESLQGVRLGLARNTAPPALSAFIRDHGNAVQVISYDHSYLQKSLKQLSAGRIGTFMFTYNSVMDELRRLEQTARYRSAGCFNAEKIYLAFSPEASQRQAIESVMMFFDQRMNTLQQNDAFKSIFDRYQLQ